MKYHIRVPKCGICFRKVDDHTNKQWRKCRKIRKELKKNRDE